MYLDDIIIFGKTLEEHNKNLGEVFKRLAQHRVKLQTPREWKREWKFTISSKMQIKCQSSVTIYRSNLSLVQSSNVQDTSRNSDESMLKALTVPIRDDDAMMVIDQTINENNLDASPNRNGEGNNPKIDSLQQQNPVKMAEETKFHHLVEDANKEPTFDDDSLFDSRNSTVVNTII